MHRMRQAAGSQLVPDRSAFRAAGKNAVLNSSRLDSRDGLSCSAASVSGIDADAMSGSLAAASITRGCSISEFVISVGGQRRADGESAKPLIFQETKGPFSPSSRDAFFGQMADAHP
jgi:hypothetical protein